MKSNRHGSGFTLIELMIVVAAIAVLAAIAYPSYLDYVRKARFSDAKQTLYHIAAEAEQYYSDNKLYPSSLTNLGHSAATINSNEINGGDVNEGYYRLTISASTATSYTLTATPQGDQAKDSRCKVFTITNTGAKGQSGGSWSASECW